jgi:hypothetical protein
MKARTKHVQFTTEAFREIAESALDELVENSETLEVQDLASWAKALSRQIGRVSDHQENGAPFMVGRSAGGDE